MSVCVPRNTGVRQADIEPISLSIAEHEGFVGNPAVSSDPFECLAEGLRRRHNIIKQPEFARIELASKCKSDAVILQSNCRFVQKRDLAWNTQSLFRLRDQLWCQSHTPEKRRHGDPRVLEARDGEAGKTALRHRN